MKSWLPWPRQVVEKRWIEAVDGIDYSYRGQMTAAWAFGDAVPVTCPGGQGWKGITAGVRGGIRAAPFG
ncbi:hypothetical protein VTN96DRAFT_7085 [Rasamsonia emersonii]